MLDTETTFDQLVETYAQSEDQAQRILDNRFYRNIAGALSGTQEYMAMEKLHELHEEGDYDLIVVDTPPTRHALDFLDAPARLTRLLDNRIFRVLMAPTRTGLRLAGAALQAFFRTVAKVVGAEVIDDVVAFFRAFEGMEDGFRERAATVLALLADPGTRFVLVTAPQRDAVDEAAFFADQIADHGLSVDALIVNRVHPQFGDEHAAGLRARAEHLLGESRDGEAKAAAARLATQYENLADFQEISLREHVHLDAVRSRIGGASIATVPFLAHDVHDFTALTEIGEQLFSGGDRPEGVR
jgi:anion-transporting  ArsA/GET3 family ATPase